MDQLSGARIGPPGDPFVAEIEKILCGTFSLDPASISTLGVNTETVNVPGVEAGMLIFVLPQTSTGANFAIIGARAPNGGQIEVTLCNPAASTQNPPLMTWWFLAVKFRR